MRLLEAQQRGSTNDVQSAYPPAAIDIICLVTSLIRGEFARNSGCAVVLFGTCCVAATSYKNCMRLLYSASDSRRPFSSLSELLRRINDHTDNLVEYRCELVTYMLQPVCMSRNTLFLRSHDRGELNVTKIICSSTLRTENYAWFSPENTRTTIISY